MNWLFAIRALVVRLLRSFRISIHVLLIRQILSRCPFWLVA